MRRVTESVPMEAESDFKTHNKERRTFLQQEDELEHGERQYAELTEGEEKGEEQEWTRLNSLSDSGKSGKLKEARPLRSCSMCPEVDSCH